MSTDDEIRECVFMALDERFDPHLAQAENLTTLFVAVHDGVSETDASCTTRYVIRVSSNRIAD